MIGSFFNEKFFACCAVRLHSQIERRHAIVLLLIDPDAVNGQ